MMLMHLWNIWMHFIVVVISGKNNSLHQEGNFFNTREQSLAPSSFQFWGVFLESSFEEDFKYLKIMTTSSCVFGWCWTHLDVQAQYKEINNNSACGESGSQAILISFQVEICQLETCMFLFCVYYPIVEAMHRFLNNIKKPLWFKL